MYASVLFRHQLTASRHDGPGVRRAKVVGVLERARTDALRRSRTREWATNAIARQGQAGCGLELEV